MSTTDRAESTKIFAENFNSSLGIKMEKSGRAYELETFADDFFSRLNNEYNKKVETEGNTTKKKFYQTQEPFKSKKRKKKSFSNSVFDEQEPWRPTYIHNRYFEKFNKLNHEHDPNSWEQLRASYVPRTYAKAKELPQGKDIFPQRKIGDYFENIGKKNPERFKLGKYGNTLMTKLINDHNKREKEIRDNEEKIWKYKHSKPPLEISGWLPFNHIKEEFSIFPADDIHSFSKEPKKKFLIEEPFLIPKKEGDYFYQRPSKAINHYYIL